MQWVMDHLQLVFVIGGAIAWWLNQRKQKQSDEDAPPPVEPTFQDPELGERTRRIREEIQRKIAQRARGGQAPASLPDEPARQATYETEPPVLTRTEPERVPEEDRPVVIRSSSRWDTQRQAEILEEQANLRERLREAQAMRTAGKRRTEFERATADRVAEARVQTRAALLSDVRSPEALRRAFIASEVLGPPVALRR